MMAEIAQNGAKSFARLKQNAKISSLRSRHLKVYLLKMRVAEQGIAIEDAATALEAESREAWKRLNALHAARVEYVAGLCDGKAINLRDGESVDGLPLSEAVEMEMRAIKNLTCIHVAELIRRDVKRVADGIKKAVQQSRKSDYAWFCENGGNRRLYNKSQNSFVEQLDVYSGDGRLLDPPDLVLGAYDRCLDFETTVSHGLRPLVIAAQLEAAEWSDHEDIANDDSNVGPESAAGANPDSV
jgi:hypothetical protein